MTLEQFSKDFLEDVLQEADSTNEYQENVFTQRFLEYLVEADECMEPQLCYFKKPGMKVNAYDLHQENDTLYLFVSLFDNMSHTKKFTYRVVEDTVNRLRTYLNKAFEGFGHQMEESSEIFDATNTIHELKGSLRHVRLYVLTNGITSPDEFMDEKFGDIEISYHVWDIERLYQFVSAGQGREELVIDFGKDFGTKIRCLQIPEENNIYDAYLAILPADLVAKIYEKWGQRLIERNVRSFLQATGNVNKGIRNTLQREPWMFMAYNNGISTTADTAVFEKDAHGNVNLIRLTGWQIVNGGQTTASLYSAAKSKIDISQASVQMKLTILKNEQDTNIVVPLISRYANSQTKINMSDFNANDEFHVKLEKHSRTIWAPNIKGKSTTKWFYERARGQYMVELSRRNTPKQKNDFKAQHPTMQKLVKTSVAKYIMSWMQYPHIVSRGSETNFVEFANLVNQEPERFIADQAFFKQMVAQAILFQTCDNIVKKFNFGGYKANIVTYTIAWLAHLAGERVDLNRIWNRQSVDEDLQKILFKLVQEVHSHITDPKRPVTNVTQWCKRDECWHGLKRRKIQIDLSSLSTKFKEVLFTAELPDEMGMIVAERLKEEEELPSAEAWFALFKWVKVTESFNMEGRNFIYTVGRFVSESKPLQQEQVARALKIYQQAIELGFDPDENTTVAG